MFDVHVFMLETEHFHQALQITVANFQQLIGLLSKELDNMVTIF